jgi:acyl-CoA thioesterase-1
VIHFNWGIWDTHLLDAEGNIVAGEDVVVSDGNGGYVSKDGKTKIRSTPAQYRENLSKIVDRLEKTHARLIFATTTPMKSRRPENQFLIDVYNETAKKLMAERGIEIDDLNKLVAESGSDWYVEDGVHFAPAGSRELGKQVSATIVPAASSWLLVGICCTTIPVLVVPWRRMKKRNESAA